MATPPKSNSSGGKYKATAAREARKLGNKEGDWNLAGSVTSRAARASWRETDHSSLPAIAAVAASPRQLFLGIEKRNDDDDKSTALSSLTAGSSSSKARVRPPHTRVIVEANSAADLVKEYLQRCPKCNSSLSLFFPTACVETLLAPFGSTRCKLPKLPCRQLERSS